MARTEAKLNCVAIEQQLKDEYWNWTDDELQRVEDNPEIETWVNIIYDRLNDSECEIFEMYGIIHDKDVNEHWDESIRNTVITPKVPHLHIVVKFNNGKGGTLTRLSNLVGTTTNYLRKADKGKWGYDNLLSYLTHIKHNKTKYEYSVSEVFTKVGKPYEQVYAERQADWIRGRAKIEYKQAKDSIDEFELKLLNGEVTKNQMLLTKPYFEIYARNKRRCDEAIEMFHARKVAQTIQAWEAGLLKLSVVFITGRPGAGKTRFANDYINYLCNKSAEDFGEPNRWSVCRVASSNPMDDYKSQEILFMDDIRGSALDATAWLNLLDPYSQGKLGRRYKNTDKAFRTVVITSTIQPYEFFYYTKGIGGDRSEPMDQFIRRIMACVTVKNYDEYLIEEAEQLVEPLLKTSPSGDLMELTYQLANKLPVDDLSRIEALEYLSNRVMANNNLKDEKHQEKYEEKKTSFLEKVTSWFRIAEKEKPTQATLDDYDAQVGYEIEKEKWEKEHGIANDMPFDE